MESHIGLATALSACECANRRRVIVHIMCTCRARNGITHRMATALSACGCANRHSVIVHIRAPAAHVMESHIGLTTAFSACGCANRRSVMSTYNGQLPRMLWNHASDWPPHSPPVTAPPSRSTNLRSMIVRMRGLPCTPWSHPSEWPRSVLLAARGSSAKAGAQTVVT